MDLFEKIHAHEKSGKQNFLSKAVSKKWVDIDCVRYQFVILEHEARVQLTIESKFPDQNKKLYKNLKKDFESRKDQNKEYFEWLERPSCKGSLIKYEVEPKKGLLDKNQWEDIQNKMVDAMKKFSEVLNKHLIKDSR